MAKIIFFSPHSLIWVHAFPEAIVAESLMKSGHEIVYITCGESLNASCICLESMGVNPGSPDARRVQVCQQCSLRANLIRKEMKLPGYSLSSIAQVEDDERVNSIMATLTAVNFSELVLEDMPIGKIAAYEFLIKHKKMKADFSENDWQQYYPKLQSAIKVFFLVKRIFDQEKPDYAISYNSLYSVNAVFSYLARKKGVTQYFMHAGENLSNRFKSLIMGREAYGYYTRGQMKQWALIKDLPCGKELLTDVTEHFLELLRGRNVFAYSAPKSKSSIDVRKYFKISPNQKILVATMSSYDELFAAEFVGERPKSEDLLFKTQADWIKVLLEWIKNKPENFLIIRVHPREFPNKRETVKSQYAGILQALLVNLPENVKVNWPEDGLSLYDLACEADVFLNAWSGVGQEMSLLGLPVVVYSKQALAYPADLNHWGQTESQYFDLIEQSLKNGWSFEQVRKTYRWFALLFGRSQIRIDESYNGPRVYQNILERKLAGGLRRLFPLLQEEQDCKNRSAHLKHSELLNQMFTKGMNTSIDVVNAQAGQVPTLDQETAYIKIEMQRIAEVMWGDINNLQEGSNSKLFLKFKSCVMNGEKY